MIKNKIFYLIFVILCFHKTAKSNEIQSDTGYIISFIVADDPSLAGYGVCGSFYRDFFLKTIIDSSINIVNCKYNRYLDFILKGSGAEHIFDYNTRLIEQNNKIKTKIKGSINELIDSNKSDSLAFKIISNYKEIKYCIYIRKVIVQYYRLENMGVLYYPEVSDSDKTYLSIKDIKYLDTIDFDFINLLMRFLNNNGFYNEKISLE